MEVSEILINLGGIIPSVFFPKLLNYVAGRRTVVENNVHLKELPRGRRPSPRTAGETGGPGNAGDQGSVLLCLVTSDGRLTHEPRLDPFGPNHSANEDHRFVNT